MSRLQTKCIFGSAAFHALLLVMLVVGSAFVSQKPKEVQVPIFNMFNVQVTDFETKGGGGGGVPTPVQDVKPTPTPPAQKPVEPTPVPIVKQPEPVKPEPVKEPKAEPVKTITPPKAKDTPKPKPIAKVPEPKVKIPENKNQDAVKIPEPPKKHEVKVDLTKVIKPDLKLEEEKAKRRQEREDTRKRAIAEARAEEIRQAQAFQQAVTDAHAKAQADAQQRSAALDRIANTLSTQGAGASPISIPGPGSQAFVNYSQLVWSTYYQAWETPQDRGRNPSVGVEIVIARDGRVVSAKITQKSGDISLDKSVQQALDRVRRLPAFPVGATDETRTFKLNFIPKPKRELG